MEKQGDEGNFKAQSLPWGQWVEGFENKLIEHNGTFYLRYYDVKNADVKSVWLVNGRLATEEETKIIIDYLKSKKEKQSSSRQADAGLTENQVKPKVVKISSISYLAVNKMVYNAEEKVSEMFATR